MTWGEAPRLSRTPVTAGASAVPAGGPGMRIPGPYTLTKPPFAGKSPVDPRSPQHYYGLLDLKKNNKEEPRT
jgi:hypothetical protein